MQLCQRGWGDARLWVTTDRSAAVGNKMRACMSFESNANNQYLTPAAHEYQHRLPLHSSSVLAIYKLHLLLQGTCPDLLVPRYVAANSVRRTDGRTIGIKLHKRGHPSLLH